MTMSIQTTSDVIADPMWHTLHLSMCYPIPNAWIQILDLPLVLTAYYTCLYQYSHLHHCHHLYLPGYSCCLHLPLALATSPTHCPCHLLLPPILLPISALLFLLSMPASCSCCLLPFLIISAYTPLSLFLRVIPAPFLLPVPTETTQRSTASTVMLGNWRRGDWPKVLAISSGGWSLWLLWGKTKRTTLEFSSWHLWPFYTTRVWSTDESQHRLSMWQHALGTCIKHSHEMEERHDATAQQWQNGREE